MDRDYNVLFLRFESYCVNNNWCNLFRYIQFDELDKLNFLLDRFLLFVENFEGDLEDYEMGDEILKLYSLIENLLNRDLNSEG